MLLVSVCLIDVNSGIMSRDIQELDLYFSDNFDFIFIIIEVVIELLWVIFILITKEGILKGVVGLLRLLGLLMQGRCRV